MEGQYEVNKDLEGLRQHVLQSYELCLEQSPQHVPFFRLNIRLLPLQPQAQTVAVHSEAEPLIDATWQQDVGLALERRLADEEIRTRGAFLAYGAEPLQAPVTSWPSVSLHESTLTKQTNSDILKQKAGKQAAVGFETAAESVQPWPCYKIQHDLVARTSQEFESQLDGLVASRYVSTSEIFYEGSLLASFGDPRLSSAVLPGSAALKPLVRVSTSPGAAFTLRQPDANLGMLYHVVRGGPMVWISIGPANKERLESCLHSNLRQTKHCGAFVRHTKAWPLRRELEKHAIPYTLVWQQQGQVLVVLPGAALYGFSVESNIVEWKHFAPPTWSLTDYKFCNVAVCGVEAEKGCETDFLAPDQFCDSTPGIEAHQTSLHQPQKYLGKKTRRKRRRDKEGAEEDDFSPSSDGKRRKGRRHDEGEEAEEEEEEEEDEDEDDRASSERTNGNEEVSAAAATDEPTPPSFVLTSSGENQSLSDLFLDTPDISHGAQGDFDMSDFPISPQHRTSQEDLGSREHAALEDDAQCQEDVQTGTLDEMAAHTLGTDAEQTTFEDNATAYPSPPASDAVIMQNDPQGSIAKQHATSIVRSRTKYGGMLEMLEEAARLNNELNPEEQRQLQVQIDRLHQQNYKVLETDKLRLIFYATASTEAKCGLDRMKRMANLMKSRRAGDDLSKDFEAPLFKFYDVGRRFRIIEELNGHEAFMASLRWYHICKYFIDLPNNQPAFLDSSKRTGRPVSDTTAKANYILDTEYPELEGELRTNKLKELKHLLTLASRLVVLADNLGGFLVLGLIPQRAFNLNCVTDESIYTMPPRVFKALVDLLRSTRKVREVLGENFEVMDVMFRGLNEGSKERPESWPKSLYKGDISEAPNIAPHLLV